MGLVTAGLLADPPRLPSSSISSLTWHHFFVSCWMLLGEVLPRVLEVFCSSAQASYARSSANFSSVVFRDLMGLWSRET